MISKPYCLLIIFLLLNKVDDNCLLKKSISSKEISSEAIEQANQISKGLIALGESKRPLLDYLINNARISGYKSIYLIIGEDSKLFKTTYSNNPNFSDLSISFIPST